MPTSKGRLAYNGRYRMCSLLPTLPAPVARFLALLADGPDYGEGLAFTYAASVILPATGWEGASFASTLAEELTTPATLAALEEFLCHHEAGRHAPFSFSLRTEDGTHVAFLGLPRPAGLGGAVMAIAPQPAIRDAADTRKNTLMHLLDTFPMYVVIIDSKHTVRFANRVARQFFGKIEGTPCYRGLRSRPAPCSTCIPFGLFADKAVKTHDWICEKRNTAFRAHSYPFVFDGDEECIMQVGINITAGLRVRYALDLSEQRYRSIAENLTLGLALVDPSLTLITVNPKMAEWFGATAAKGTNIEQLLQHACCGGTPGAQACVFRQVLGDSLNHEGEFQLPLDQGGERSFRLVACPITTRKKQVRAIVIMLEDVTDRLIMARRMQQMQRLEALGSLAGGIAHEINQPLSALHLYASGMQMMLEQGASASPERILERLGLILSQADKIRQIINHMRALVMQEENPPLGSVHIGLVAKEALSLVGMQLQEHNISIALDIPEGTPTVKANAVQLEQVIINLLVNAMHALDSVEGGPKSITIAASHSGGKTVALQIIDTGSGIGPAQGKIFDPFFTTKEVQGGMGLGLSIVHAFVSSWGGTVEATNNPSGQGAVFTLHLAAAE